MVKAPLYQHIARILKARENCAIVDGAGAPRNVEWYDNHTTALDYIARELLPSGSGVDSGTTIDLSASRTNRIVLLVSYHHMDSYGGYAGWSDYRITVRPDLAHGFDLQITGRDRNETKDYLADLYSSALSEPIESSRAWYGLQEETETAPASAPAPDARAETAFCEALETLIDRAARKNGSEVQS